MTEGPGGPAKKAKNAKKHEKSKKKNAETLCDSANLQSDTIKTNYILIVHVRTRSGPEALQSECN